MTGMVDLHSHHLPAMDDGPRDLETAVAQVRRLGTIGYRVLVTTPHVIEGRWDYRADDVVRAVDALQRAVGASPEIRVGAELRFDGGFLAMLDRDELVPLGGRGRAVLVEFSWPKLPSSLLDALYRIQLKGYTALLAHPDRYENDEDDFLRLEEWVARGGLLQVELGSLAGRYGPAAMQACRRLLREGLAFAAAADAHHPDDVEAHVIPGLAELTRLVGNSEAEQLCRERPLRLIEATDG